VLSSVWLYGAWIGWDWRGFNTAAGLLFFYCLLATDRATWFWNGFFIGLLWFWWIGVSFIYYHMTWAIPIVLIVIGLVYGGIFWGVAWGAERFSLLLLHYGVQWHTLQGSSKQKLFTLILKSFALLSISHFHPLGFDWFKPELVFVSSYLGIHKWQLAIVLLAIVLAQWRTRPLWLLLAVLAYSPTQVQTLPEDPRHTIKLIATDTTIADKWNPDKVPEHIRQAMGSIHGRLALKIAAIIASEKTISQ